MPIFRGDNWQHLYKGDGHPAALYKGSKKLAGWTEKSQAGVSHAYFDDTYNDKADVVIHGKSTQVETTGAQLFDASRINDHDEHGIILTNNGDGSITITGEGLSTGVFPAYYTVRDFKLKPGNLYLKQEIATRPYFYVQLVNSNNSVIKQALYSALQIQITQEDIDNTAYLRFGFYIGANYEIVPGTIKPMVYQDGDGTWEPYTGGAPSPSPDYPQEIVSLADSGSVEIVSAGKNLYGGGDLEGIKKGAAQSFTINWPGGAGTIKFEIGGNAAHIYLAIRYYDENDEWQGANGTESVKNVGDEMTFIFKGLNAAQGENIDMQKVKKIKCEFSTYSSSEIEDLEWNAKNIFVSPGVSIGDFPGYFPQTTATYTVENGLPGIPVSSGGNYTDADGQQWICDEIDTKAGVYRQRVGKITFDGGENEGWSSYDNVNFKGFMILEPNMKSGRRLEGMCDRFTIDKDGSSETYGIWLGVTNQYIYFHNCNPSIASSLEEWRTWLSTHPVTLLYPLATPVETPLSDAVDTFLGGTNLFISEHEMDVTVKTEDQANPTGA